MLSWLLLSQWQRQLVFIVLWHNCLTDDYLVGTLTINESSKPLQQPLGISFSLYHKVWTHSITLLGSSTHIKRQVTIEEKRCGQNLKEMCTELAVIIV